MLKNYKKTFFFLLLFTVLISLFIFNLSIDLSLDFKNKTLSSNVCQHFSEEQEFNYVFNGRLISQRDFNYGHRRSHFFYNNSETTFANISDDIYIYSAFETTNNNIVLIGFAKNCKQINEDYNYYNYNNSYKVEEYEHFCSFERSVIRTEAVVEYLPESHDYYYSAIKVKCKRPQLFDEKLSKNRVKLIQRPKLSDKTNANNKSIESDFVFIVNNNKKYKYIYTNNSNYGSNVSQESNKSTQSGSHSTPRPSEASPKELVVCVRPLYGNISAINLLQFIAYYRLNSVNKIVFYNAITSQRMNNQSKQLFTLLSSMDFVEILPFILPNNDESRPIIHANGQLTAVHDCLYRYSNYIQIHVDFDEYLFALNNKSIKELLLSKQMSGSSALVVQTVIFCNEFNEHLAKRSDPLLITNYYRQKTLWPHSIRSKVIVIRSERISKMGIHSVWEVSPFHSHQESHPISYSSAAEILIYHYRKCCDMIQPYFANIIHFHTINDYMVRDESIKPFVNRVKQFIDKYIKIVN